jgi:hypothetical protein
MVVIDFIDMQKIIIILFTIAFTVGCFGLWLTLILFQDVCPIRLTEDFINSTQLAKKILPISPIPFWLFSTYMTFRKRPTTEINLLFLAVLALTYVLLFFYIVSIIAVPFIPVINR